MPILRRSLTALSGLFLLQLTLLGSGTVCAAQHGVEGDHVAGPTAHNMNGLTAVSDADNEPMSPDDCSGLGGHDGCGLPWASGRCSFMTACDVSVAAPSSVGAAKMVRIVAHTLRSPALAESGPTFAPELPPPRA